MESKHITINVLPQSSEAWFFIACAVAAMSVAYVFGNIEPTKSLEVQKAEIAASIEIAKVQAGTK